MRQPMNFFIELLLYKLLLRIVKMNKKTRNLVEQSEFSLGHLATGSPLKTFKDAHPNANLFNWFIQQNLISYNLQRSPYNVNFKMESFRTQILIV